MKKKGQSEEWMALHDDSHFGCLKGLCDFIEHETAEHYRLWQDMGSSNSVNVQLYYPLLIVQGPLMEAVVSKRSVKLKSVQHAQFRRSIIRNGVDRVFQIDVVTERFLPAALEIIRTEFTKLALAMKSNIAILEQSIDEIVTRAGGPGSSADSETRRRQFES